MTLSDEQYQDLIIAFVGGDTEDGLLALNVPILWELRGTIADAAIRMLYVKIDAIDMLLGQAARQVTFRTSSGSSVALSDLFDHFKELRAACLSQIGGSAAGGGVAIGTLTKTAPLMPPATGELDPNAQRYRGDTRRWRP